MKTVLLAMLMIFCGAFWVGCDSEEGPAAPGTPGGTIDTLPRLGVDQSRDESVGVEQAADQIVEDAEREVEQVADEVVTQAKALADETESVASSVIADTGSRLPLDASGQSLSQFLSSAAKKIDEHKSQIATLKSWGVVLNNTDLNKLITAASDQAHGSAELVQAAQDRCRR